MYNEMYKKSLYICELGEIVHMRMVDLLTYGPTGGRSK